MTDALKPSKRCKDEHAHRIQGHEVFGNHGESRGPRRIAASEGVGDGECNLLLSDNSKSVTEVHSLVKRWVGWFFFLRSAIIEHMQILMGRNSRKKNLVKHWTTQCHETHGKMVGMGTRQQGGALPMCRKRGTTSE